MKAGNAAKANASVVKAAAPKLKTAPVVRQMVQKKAAAAE